MSRLSAAGSIAASLCLYLATAAFAAECDNRYFAPDDFQSAYPLRKPHPEFSAIEHAAKSGTASGERSLAAAYEVGYLVSRCQSQAEYWYRKAANRGDEIALHWIANYDAIARIKSAGECAGEVCPGSSKSGPRIAVFFAGRNGHYFAPVAINGVTAEGMVDTGASHMSMTEETAMRFGINHLPGDTATSMTANGPIPVKMLTLPRISVSGIELRNVKASIGGTAPLLIGMSFLSRVNVRMEAGRLAMSK